MTETVTFDPVGVGFSRTAFAAGAFPLPGRATRWSAANSFGPRDSDLERLDPIITCLVSGLDNFECVIAESDHTTVRIHLPNLGNDNINV